MYLQHSTKFEVTLHWFRIDQSATYLCRGNKLGWRRNLFMRLTQFFFLDAMIEEDRLSLKFRNRFNPSLFPILTCWYWLFYFLLLMLFVFLHYGWKGICGGRLLLVIGEGSTVLSNSLLKVHFFLVSLNLSMASFSANSIAFF